MDFTLTLPLLEGFQRFMTESAVNACHKLLLEHALDSSPTLLMALSGLFDMQPDDLHLRVGNLIARDDREIQSVISTWLDHLGLSRKQYLRRVVNTSKDIDGLFLWLVLREVQQHINLVHSDGVWTSHKSDITVLTDASIVLVLDCFLHTRKMSRLAVEKADPDYTTLLCDPKKTLHSFTRIPKVFNCLVKDIAITLDDKGLHQVGETKSLQELLSSLHSCEVQVFREQLCA